MCPPIDKPAEGPVHAQKVAQTKSLSAGFDYGDKQDSQVNGAAYQVQNSVEAAAAPIQRKVATLPAPTYAPSSLPEGQEGETTQLKKQSRGLTASAADPGDGDTNGQRNNTGLPDNLRSGVENLSGLSMQDVNVHYNSPKPAKLKAHAYAQGSDIHLASGQEKHLPHEAWHVVQQKQGRVKPTTQLKGTIPVNDNSGLEKEADVMGAKAIKNQ